jgi:hypothetical protein
MTWRNLFAVSLFSLVLLPGTAVGQSQDGSDGGLLDFLFSPFRALAEVLIDTLVDVMMNTLPIYPNPPVQQIHRLTLAVALAVSVLAVAAAGVYYIAGVELGVPYRQIRLILPRLLIALGFSAVSLPLLQLGVDASNVFVEAFRPRDSVGVEQLAGLTSSLVLVWFINAWLLLALVVLFVIRLVYLMFGAAVSPLIGVAWAFPNTKRYADSLISTWWVLLAIAPIDVLVLRFNLAMLQGSGSVGLQPISNWILGVASFTLMLWIPYQLYGASQTIVGRSTGLADDIGRSVGRNKTGKRPGETDEREGWEERQRNRRDRNRRRRK